MRNSNSNGPVDSSKPRKSEWRKRHEAEKQFVDDILAQVADELLSDPDRPQLPSLDDPKNLDQIRDWVRGLDGLK